MQNILYVKGFMEGFYMNMTYKLHLGTLCMLLALFCCHTHDGYAAVPPTEYAIWDRIPGEAFVEARLEATAPINLYDSPRGNTIVSSVATGEIVKRVSCVVYTHPQKHPVRVLRTLRSYKKQGASTIVPDGLVLQPGSYVYLLMYTGEGTYIGWYNGEEAWWLNGSAIRNFSDRASQQAWGEYIGEMTSRNLSIETWYCLRKSDGTTGWTMVAQNGDFSYEHLKIRRD